MILGDGKAAGSRAFEPQPFGRYVLLRKLATGGMGEVFLARLNAADGFEKLLVIKRIREELATDPEFVTRFLDEARTLVQLQHGAIAQVFDMGEVEGAQYIALEFVDGKDLKTVLARCQERGARVPTALALYVMTRVLDALAYAHRKKDEDDRDLNLVHRDISPPNVLLSYEGEVKLIDFGLAKSVLSLQRTQGGAFVGKFFYMAPEAARHQPLDRRADLFAVGVLLHEMLAGRHVLEGLSPGEVFDRVQRPAFPRLSGTVDGVSPALDAAIQRALSVEPAARFPTAEEMRGALAACLAELSPGLGAEQVSSFMRSFFAEEYAEERRTLRALRDEARKLAGDDRPASARSGLRKPLSVEDLPEPPARPTAARSGVRAALQVDDPPSTGSRPAAARSGARTALSLDALPEAPARPAASRSGARAPLTVDDGGSGARAPTARSGVRPALQLDPNGNDPTYRGLAPADLGSRQPASSSFESEEYVPPDEEQAQVEPVPPRTQPATQRPGPARPLPAPPESDLRPETAPAGNPIIDASDTVLSMPMPRSDGPRGAQPAPVHKPRLRTSELPGLREPLPPTYPSADAVVDPTMNADTIQVSEPSTYVDVGGYPEPPTEDEASDATPAEAPAPVSARPPARRRSIAEDDNAAEPTAPGMPEVARRSRPTGPIVVVLLLVVAALILGALALTGHLSAKGARHGRQTLGDGPASRGERERDPGQGNVERTR